MGTRFTETERDLIRQIFPEHGAAGCVKVMQNRTTTQIRSQAHIMGLISKAGEQMKKRMERKPDGPYIPTGAEAAKYEEQRVMHLALQNFVGYIAAEPLRPIVKVELEKVA